jgi:hypothetical protein
MWSQSWKFVPFWGTVCYHGSFLYLLHRKLKPEVCKWSVTEFWLVLAEIIDKMIFTCLIWLHLAWLITDHSQFGLLAWFYYLEVSVLLFNSLFFSIPHRCYSVLFPPSVLSDHICAVKYITCKANMYWMYMCVCVCLYI